MKRALVSTLIGMILGAIAVAAVALPVIHEQRRRASDGWHPLPALVYARDVAAGQVLRDGDLARREVPAQFVTASNIPVEEASSLPTRLLERSVQAGDPVLWQDFASDRIAEIRACLDAAAR